MTHEEIIAMANEAGLNSYRIPPSQAVDVWTRFAALVAEKAAAKERGACGKVKAGKPRELSRGGAGLLEHQFCFEKGFREGAAAVRAAIRARGQKDGA